MKSPQIFQALSALVLLGFAPGCSGPECRLNSDCPIPGSTCVGEVCVAPTSACNPACGGQTPVCDEVRGKCMVCTPEAGCPSGMVCDVASSSRGVCVECLSNDECSGARPICDREAGACVTCTLYEGCGFDETCDLTVPDGRCRRPEVSCTSNAHCSGQQPVCDLIKRYCVTCTASEGCGAGQYCDTTVAGGQCKQQQTGCTSNSNCGGTTPICQVSSGLCVVCTATAGCGAGQYCDTMTSSIGQCRQQQTGCTSNANCGGATPTCNLSTGACVVCTTTAGCGAGQYCDISVPGGQCRTQQTGCTSDAGCGGAYPICELSTGACVVCTASAGCGAGQYCDTSVFNGQCKTQQTGCTSNASCGGATPVCDTSTSQCVRCTSNQGCAYGEVCDTRVAGGACVGCLSNANCGGATPICDLATSRCVTCTATSGCSGATPRCDTSSGSGACVACLANGDCPAATPICNAYRACEAAPVNGTSAQIAAVRAAGAGIVDGSWLDVGLPVSGALVTYLKPGIGNLANDPAGFFVQADQTGPALFVAMDPASFYPAIYQGDRLNFTVVQLGKNAGLLFVSSISDVTRQSMANPTGPLVQDLSGVSDLLSTIDSYESEMVRLTGVIASRFTSTGLDHTSARFETAGMKTDSMRLRLPEALRAQLGLEDGCSLTMAYGPMWRFNATVQPSVYSAGDLTGISCPGPRVLSAYAASSNQVVVLFDRPLQASSVAANGAQFTFLGGLSAYSATVNGSKVELGTSAQASGVSYTLTVATTVRGVSGVGLNAAHTTAQFTGYSSGPVCYPSQVVISQLYGGGGNSGAPFTNDFVELHNRGSTPVDVSTWSLQYASASGTNWLVMKLAGSIAPGGYYLVQLHAQTAPQGGPLPVSPDLDLSGAGGTNMGGSAGKLGLVKHQSWEFADAYPILPAISVSDFVGFGYATAAEGGSTATAIGASNTTSLWRNGDGCIDTDNNASDFVAMPPMPRNSLSPPVYCGCN